MWGTYIITILCAALHQKRFITLHCLFVNIFQYLWYSNILWIERNLVNYWLKENILNITIILCVFSDFTLIHTDIPIVNVFHYQQYQWDKDMKPWKKNAAQNITCVETLAFKVPASKHREACFWISWLNMKE